MIMPRVQSWDIDWGDAQMEGQEPQALIEIEVIDNGLLALWYHPFVAMESSSSSRSRKVGKKPR